MSLFDVVAVIWGFVAVFVVCAWTVETVGRGVRAVRRWLHGLK